MWQVTDEGQSPASALPAPGEIPTNPGGTLLPQHVLGRDELIARYWEVLKTRSIALLAPRRVGKTSIARRMIAYPPPGFIVHSRDLEDIEDVVHFVRALFEDVEAHLGSFTRVATRGRAVLDGLGLVKIKDFQIELGKLSWRKLLDQLFADLNEHAQDSGQVVVLVWDEFTYFIGELAYGDDVRDAMELLDSLRAARQTYPFVRMVLTGSIGLPEIERRLRDAGHRNRALNDISAEVVPLFDEANARVVIAALGAGAGLELEADTVDALVERSEGHPMIIQLLVEGLKARGRTDTATIDAVFQGLLEPPGDPLDLRYYSERIDQNFDADEARLARAILDALARSPDQTLDDMLASLGPTIAPELDRTQLAALLRHLIDDFYLVRNQGRHRFRLDFLRRFWAEERGL